MKPVMRWLLLPMLTLVFFLPLVLNPTGLMGPGFSDVIYQHYPAKHFWVTSTQETGEIPLWAPDQFAGSPFVHDPQVGMFYPLHWPMLIMPVSALAGCMSWLVVLHILIAGVGMYCYARYRGMSVFASQITAIGFMFSGKWLMHMLVAGHTILSGLAWLPWAILALEWAITRGRVLGALLGGLAFALLALSVHPQWTLYAGVFLVVWLMGAVWETPTDRDSTRGQRLRRYVSYGLLAGMMALGLFAVQMLPTLTASQASSRTLPTGELREPISVGEKLASLVGPMYTTEQRDWESLTSLGVMWVVLAAYALAIGSFRVRFTAVVLIGVIVLATLPEWFWGKWPGFRLFRFHGRMTTFAAFPLSMLVGTLTDVWCKGDGPALVRRGLLASGVILAGWVGCVAVFLLQRSARNDVTFLGNSYWVIVPALVGMILLLLTGRIVLRPMLALVVWFILLLIDLWLPMAGSVVVHTTDNIYGDPPVVQWLRSTAVPQGRVLDRTWDFDPQSPPIDRIAPTPIGNGAYQAVLHQIPSVFGYNPMDVGWYREYWLRIQNRPEVLPPKSDMVHAPFFGHMPIRNSRLIDLLGVRYAVMPLDRPPPANWLKRTEQAPSRVFAIGQMFPVDLPAYGVYENPQAFPRAFVVESLKPLPVGDALITAFQQEDFRKVALVEDLPADYPQPENGASQRAVTIERYQPNRVDLSVESGVSGTLVLMDVWFAEWVCRVDGKVVPIVRVNSAFRGVPIPSHACKVTFTLESRSLIWGMRISLLTLAISGIISVVLLGRRRWSRVTPSRV